MNVIPIKDKTLNRDRADYGTWPNIVANNYMTNFSPCCNTSHLVSLKTTPSSYWPIKQLLTQSFRIFNRLRLSLDSEDGKFPTGCRKANNSPSQDPNHLRDLFQSRLDEFCPRQAWYFDFVLIFWSSYPRLFFMMFWRQKKCVLTIDKPWIWSLEHWPRSLDRIRKIMIIKIIK